MRPFLTVLIVFLIVILAILVINTTRFSSKQTEQLSSTPRTYAVDDSAVLHVSRAIQLATISLDEISKPDTFAFDGLIDFLKTTYPLVNKNLEVTLINHRSLLYHWKGKDEQILPVLFYAHLDVVPAGDNIASEWKYPPFSGAIRDGSIWGRGAVDDKGSLVSILEAVERLLKNNFQPQHDIYFAFGHDEELGGNSGAREIALYLEKRNIKVEFMLDEGGLVSEGIVPFVEHPVALIGTAEKGFLTLALTIHAEGGHSSMPARETAIDILASAIVKLKEHPFTPRATEPLLNFIKYVGPEMKMPYKTLFANQWLFRRVIFHEYANLKGGNAMIRTTGVTTVIHSGIKANVIPSDASALVNFRILPGETNKSVINRVNEIINDERISVKVSGENSEPSQISSITSNGFKLIEKTVHAVFPDAIVAPQLLIGGTDSRHFSKIAENIYRFIPVRMTQEILDGMHGPNERIKISGLMESIAFYETMMRSL